MKKGNKNLLVVLFIIILIVILVVIGIVAYRTKSVKNPSDDKENITQNTQTVEPVEDKTDSSAGTQNLVFFGVDTRAKNLSSGTRSDSIMLVHIDHDAKTVKIASIYRDCMVNIEGHGYEKITHAHSYGGPELALDTINKNFDLNMENYVTVNFVSVGDLVDKMGGIQQDIDDAEVKYINSYIDEVNNVRGTSSSHITSAGSYTLDGTQAVAYSRIRYTAGSDYKRTERQRTILFKIFEKSKTMSTVERIKIAEMMLGEINTDMHTDKMTELLYHLQDYSIEDMSAYPQVFYGGSVDGAWVEVPVTLIDMASGLHQFLLGEADYVPSDTVTGSSSVLQGKAGTANMDMSGAGEK